MLGDNENQRMMLKATEVAAEHGAPKELDRSASSQGQSIWP